MTDFNVWDDPWIEVADLDHGRVLVGVGEAMKRAHRIGQLLINPEDGYAPVLRFLIGVFAASGAAPVDRGDWVNVWRADSFDADVIDDYARHWRHRFNLLDHQHPFRQCPDLTPNRASDQLRAGAGASRVGRRFGLDGDAARSQWTLPEAVIPLLRLHEYDPAGIKPGIPKGKTYGAVPGPLGTSTTVYPHGPTLKDTLLLCLPPSRRVPGDAPAWERAPQVAGIDTRIPTGPLDWSTWPARSVRLFATGGRITDVALHDGRRLPKTAEPQGLDPNAAWRTNGARGHFANPTTNRSTLTMTMSTTIPWTADTASVYVRDETWPGFARSPGIDHLVDVSHDIDDTPIRLHFASPWWGTQRAVLNGIEHPWWYTTGIPAGTGHLWSDQDRLAVLGLVAAWPGRAPKVVRAAVREAPTSIRDIAEASPRPDLDPTQWSHLVDILSTADTIADATDAVTTIINTITTHIATWLDYQISPQLRFRRGWFSRAWQQLHFARHHHLREFNTIAGINPNPDAPAAVAAPEQAPTPA